MPSRGNLEEYVETRDKRSAGFAALVRAAEQRREFAKTLASERKRRGLSQTRVAARMGTSASMVHCIEAGLDVRMSTMEEYAAALGSVVRMSLKQA